MRFRSSHPPQRAVARRLILAFGCCALLVAATAAKAQVNPFRSSRHGTGLTKEHSRLLFESVDRLNAAEPAEVGRSEAWRDPKTKSSGKSTIRRVFQNDGQACHLVHHHVAVAGRPARDYDLTWCRTQAGDWKIKD